MLSKNSPTVTHDRENQCTVEEEVASLLINAERPSAFTSKPHRSSMQNAQGPAMSSNTVYFSVSQQYSNQLEPECLPGQPHIQECLETVQHCVGENLWA